MGIKPNVLSIVVPKVTFRKDGIKTVLFCPVTSVSTQYIVPPPYGPRKWSDSVGASEELGHLGSMP